MLVVAGSVSWGACSTTHRASRPPLPFARGERPLVIGHRGGALERPENTLAALRHAVRVGTDWQEIDVTLSADDVVVVIHDDTLERTTNGTGLVGQHTLQQLETLSAGQPRWSQRKLESLHALGVTTPDFGDAFVHERIPTLEQALALEGTRLMIEMKRIEPDKVRLLACKVVEAVRAQGAGKRVILGSFDIDLLRAAHHCDPSLSLVGIAETSAAIDAHLNLPVAALAVSIGRVEEAVSKAPPHVAVWAWTVCTPKMAHRALNQRAHGLITDVPSALLQHLRPGTQ